MKTILVTGATSGLGFGVCNYLLDRNYNVLAIGRNKKAIENFENRQNFSFFDFDLNDISNYSKIFENMEKLDGLVHCAGIEETIPLSLYTNYNVKEIFNINVFSGIELLRFFSKKKHSNNSSSVVLLSSVMGELGQPGKVGYCATKAAVLGVVKSAALELSKRKIRVNAVSPGVVLTPMTQKLFSQLDEENIDAITNMHPLGIGEVDDVVPMIEFLLSDNSKWITGQNFKIDGGYSIQ